MTDATTPPTVSVIIAAYNGASMIRETLDSLRAQSFADFEVIVVDDASSDDTLAVLRGYDDPRLRVIASDANAGPVRTRNRAFGYARGRYFAALDQDDLCHPERLARQVAYLDARPEVVLVATAAAELRDGRLSPGRAPAVSTPALIGWLLALENPLVWSSVMFRADSARRLDPISRPDILYAEDFDLYHRLSRFGAIARIDEELTIYRRHAGGASQRFDAIMLASATRVLAKAHQPHFGDAALRTATLVARHILDGQPIHGTGTLVALSDIISGLRDDALAQADIDPLTARLIGAEASRLWWQLAHGAIRSGLLAISGAIAARPDGISLAASPPARLITSGLIGGGRALLRHVA